jgi:hypothetical protein
VGLFGVQEELVAMAKKSGDWRFLKHKGDQMCLIKQAIWAILFGKFESKN